jgi:amidase
MRTILFAALAVLATPVLAQPAPGPVEAKVIADLARIAALDRAGPRLNSVLAIDPNARLAARAIDRRRSFAPEPLRGFTLLLKDSVETADLPTTAGSLALKDNITGRTAPAVRGLTNAGAVILGKANLSEWSNFRSNDSISGWSAIGGLTRNPHALDRTPCGSSSGSAVAVAAGLVTAAIGAETDGSITCPASMNGVVGLKPTVGLVSRTHVIPISPEQDTLGPIARTVGEAAVVLTALTGGDPDDPATSEADQRKSDYARLQPAALKGARLGVWRINKGRSAATDAVFETALVALQAQGAVLVELTGPERTQMAAIGTDEEAALKVEFRAALDAYLANAAPAVRVRSLADLIAFNAATPRETALFGQDILLAALKASGLDDPAYQAQRHRARTGARALLDHLLAQSGGVDAVIAPTNGPAGVIDPVNGEVWLGSVSTLPAVSGYPHLTVPMGQVAGLPVGLSFIGPAWSEARLLSLGAGFEQATHARVAPTFPGSALMATTAAAYDRTPAMQLDP